MFTDRLDSYPTFGSSLNDLMVSSFIRSYLPAGKKRRFFSSFIGAENLAAAIAEDHRYEIKRALQPIFPVSQVRH